MYDPKMGRWLSEDPKGFEAGDVNLYRYAKNNPTNRTDPSGLDSISVDNGVVYWVTQERNVGYVWTTYTDSIWHRIGTGNGQSTRLDDFYGGGDIENSTLTRAANTVYDRYGNGSGIAGYPADRQQFYIQSSIEHARGGTLGNTVPQGSAVSAGLEGAHDGLQIFNNEITFGLVPTYRNAADRARANGGAYCGNYRWSTYFHGQATIFATTALTLGMAPAGNPAPAIAAPPAVVAQNSARIALTTNVPRLVAVHAGQVWQTANTGISHAVFVARMGVPAGAWVGTVLKGPDGIIVAFNSMTYYRNQNIAPAAVIETLRNFFQ